MKKRFLELSDEEQERALLLHEKEFEVIETRPLGDDGPIVLKIVTREPRLAPRGNPISKFLEVVLAASWITPELADQAGIERVDSLTGGQLVGRNGSGDQSTVFPGSHGWVYGKRVPE